MNSPAWVIVFVSALTDFIITACGSLTGAMVANGTIAMPPPAVWLFAILFGLGAAGKEIRLNLRLPPVNAPRLPPPAP